jgi:hypothetical protein
MDQLTGQRGLEAGDLCAYTVEIFSLRWTLSSPATGSMSHAILAHPDLQKLAIHMALVD